MIIDIVSKETKTPEQQAEALDAIKNTIIIIFSIVVIGYEHFCCQLEMEFYG